jgi:uncharacterized protein DUF4397
MNKQINLGLVLAALLLTVACSSVARQTQSVTSSTDAGTSTAPATEEVAQRDNALVRVINAVPGVTSFDVFADDQKVFEEVSFKSVTPYTELSDNRHTFRVRQAGQDTAPVTAEDIADGAPFRVNQPGQDSAQPVAERRGIELHAERLEKNTSIWSFLTLLFFAALILLGFFLVKDYLKDYRVKDYRRLGRPHNDLVPSGLKTRSAHKKGLARGSPLLRYPL